MHVAFTILKWKKKKIKAKKKKKNQVTSKPPHEVAVYLDQTATSDGVFVVKANRHFRWRFYLKKKIKFSTWTVLWEILSQIMQSGNYFFILQYFGNRLNNWLILTNVWGISYIENPSHKNLWCQKDKLNNPLIYLLALVLTIIYLYVFYLFLIFLCLRAKLV